MPNKGSPDLADNEEILVGLNFKVAVSLRDRVQKAARECDMSQSEWLRAVLGSAVDLHERSEVEAVADDEDEEPESWDLLQAKIRQRRAEDDEREAADALRQRRDGKPKHRVPVRECPHMPSKRRGNRCGDCGITLNLAFRSTLGGLAANR